jgi:hypothetical protein
MRMQEKSGTSYFGVRKILHFEPVLLRKWSGCLADLATASDNMSGEVIGKNSFLHQIEKLFTKMTIEPTAEENLF